MYSRESLQFIPRAAGVFPLFDNAVRRARDRFRATHGYELDFRKGWWTPPLSAREAHDLEQAQIENGLELKALVSLTDHDNIEAGATLRSIERYRNVPISTEWTVPYGPTFFHLGIHNLPMAQAQPAMEAMKAFTANARRQDLMHILEWLSSFKETLVVFNHPCWDENGIGAAAHDLFAQAFIDFHRPYLHAVELNGLRPWKENKRVLDLARAWNFPIISGGDRHAHEPNATLNLTKAPDFAGFVTEVKESFSSVLLMPQYHEPFRLRILHNLCDILSEQHGHAEGWRLWSDRVFFELNDGTTKNLTAWLGDNPPLVLRGFVGLAQQSRRPQVTSVLRFVCGGREPTLIWNHEGTL